MGLFRKPLRIDVVWRRLAALTAHTWTPEGVARQGVLSRMGRRLLLAWLRPLEAIARRLLLIEALALAPLESAGAGRPRPAARPGAPLPGSRGVRFRLMPERRRKRERMRVRRTARAVRADRPSLPLARRIEALRQVIANRQPAVRRLARLLRSRPKIVRAAFRPIRPGASFQHARRLLHVVQVRAEAAAGWDSS